MSLLRTKSRDNVRTTSIVGQLLDRPGRVDSFRGLVADFYNLKMKKTSAGRLVLGDWSGRYRVYWSGHLCLIGSQEDC